jgi:hypothetical protein
MRGFSLGCLNRECHKAFSTIEYVLGDAQKNRESSSVLDAAEKRLWRERFNEWNGGAENAPKRAKIDQSQFFQLFYCVVMLEYVLLLVVEVFSAP